MKKLKFIVPFIVLTSLFGAGLLFADWNPGDPAKWVQYPDTTPMGIDIRVDNRGGQRAIGDDFKCTETGPITDVHLWVSWKTDVTGPISGITLSFYSDDPAGPGGSDPGNFFSKPDFLLWSRPFSSIEFTTRLYDIVPSPDYEGWWDPRGGGYIPNGDHNIYQLNFNIPPSEAYYQEGSPEFPIIYWLVVEAQLPSPGSTMLGWKTRSYFEAHFNDDAVWRSTPASSWIELRYPAGHPYYQDSIDMAFVITSKHTEPNNKDFGDAPEGSNAIAYPATGVTGSFPTCMTVGPANWVQHTSFGAFFGPSADFEGDGNAGWCPGCFPPYDQDECFNDGDAGLIMPDSYTIDAALNVVPCPMCGGSALGGTCQWATWGTNIDIDVQNYMPGNSDGYVNLLIDWNQDGRWGGASPCPMAATPEHVLVNYIVPNGYEGPLSGLMPVGSGFLIGPNPDFVWARFSITEVPVNTDWNGEGSFEDGETEDYLFYLYSTMEPTEDFGDAPQGPYPTKLDKDGARHTVVPGIFLGVQIDAEFDGQPDGTATGDDVSNLSDEDGVAFTAITPGTWSTVYITPSVDGYINAWMDFNADGDWDDIGERIFTDYAVFSALINACTFQVPFYASPATSSFARFRYTTYVTAPPMNYTGQEADGEVEDYMVYITENPAIKWVQMPDLEPNGINIKVDDMMTIADDFLCTSYGLITDVHFWGSWKYDNIGSIMNIHLSIHSDDPIGEGGSRPDNEYSMPDELLWERDFSSTEFHIGDEIYLPDGEYWWDPSRGELIPGGDHFVWRIDIDIPEDEAFRQEGSPEQPVIYWLDIKVMTAAGTEFGWKTRKFPAHFMDDAVFYNGSELPPTWEEMRYPLEHPYHPNSIDMAFVLTGKELKQPVPNLKWSQPPIEIDPTYDEVIYCGWNEESWTQNPEEPIFNRAAADDFRCLGSMPITSIHWWGSFVGWDYEEPLILQPERWNIKFYENIPAAPGSDPDYSHPGNVLFEINIPNDRVETEFAGWDEYIEMPYETCYQHYVELEPEEYFWQDDYNDATYDNIYWLGITAVYPGDVIVEFPWGWKTRPAHWMDDAVRYEGRLVGWEIDPDTGELIPIIAFRFWPIEDPIFGESFDLAFELDTDPNYIKWEQPFTGIRDWPHYEDKLSMAYENETTATKYVQEPDLAPTGMDVLAGPLSVDPEMQNVYETFLADDFICTDTGPITDIHLWASYNEDIMMTDTPWFSLVIYENIPASESPTGYSMPGAPLWDAYVQPTNQWVYATADESFYDPNRGIIGFDTMVWRFDFDIDHAEAFVQQEGKIYWLGVHHSFDLNLDGMVNIMDLMKLKSIWPGVFGWKTSMEHFEDDAVWTKVLTFGGNPHVVPSGIIWSELRYPMGHPFEGRSIDLAFEITTQSNNVDVIQKAADDWPCEHRTPVTAITWFGSYIGYRYLTPCSGTIMPPPVSPDYFVITIHKDVPADDPGNAWGFSHPGENVWQYTAYDYDEVLVGYDKHPEQQIGPREPVYRYSVRLPEEHWFKQRKYNEVYWISIMAVYKPDAGNQFDWGWTIHKHVFNDDAVVAFPLAGGPGDPDGWWFEKIHDQTGESADLSFILFTDPTICVDCADYDFSGLVNFRDFAVFALDWLWTGLSGGYANGDLNCDGKVNYEDLQKFTNQWLTSCP